MRRWRGPGIGSVVRPAGVIVAVALAAFLPLACGDDPPESGEVQVDRGLLGNTTEVHYDTLDDWPGAAELESTFRVEWPDSTRDIDLFQGGFQDPYYLARFTIDADDLDQLLGPAACRDLEPVAAVGADADGSGEPDWWPPDDATGQCRGDGANWFQEIRVVDRGDGELTVYLSVYTI